MELLNYIADWIVSNRSALGGNLMEFQRFEEPAKTVYAAFEASNHMIEIRAWDYGPCLDIYVISKETGNNIFSTSGPCEGIQEVTVRLNALLKYIKQFRI